MKNVHVFVPVFLYAVTMLIFQFKRIISSEKWCNYVVTFFFSKMPKIWVGRTTVNGEKKEDGLSEVREWNTINNLVRNPSETEVIQLKLVLVSSSTKFSVIF